MSNTNNNVRYNGVGFFGLLGLMFIGLKLTGYIDWSWWLVLLPIYGGIAFFLITLIIVFVIMVIAAAKESKRGR